VTAELEEASLRVVYIYCNRISQIRVVFTNDCGQNCLTLVSPRSCEKLDRFNPCIGNGANFHVILFSDGINMHANKFTLSTVDDFALFTTRLHSF
jgi:hypothetical protein